MLVEVLSSSYIEVRYTPGADIPAGTMTQLEDIYGFPLADVPSGEEGAFIIQAEKVRMPKLAGVTFLKGEALYWLSAGTDNLSNVDGGADDILMGFTVAPEASATVLCEVVFDGREEFRKA